MPAAIILAAGASTRLGRAKQTVLFDGETLLDRAVRIAHTAGLSPVIVVIADPALIPALQQQDCLIALNESSHEGIASSIRRGVHAASLLKLPGAVLMTCDQPTLTSAHLRALCHDLGTTTGSAYAGRIGVPAYFPSSSFDALLDLQGDTGARSLLRNAPAIPAEDLALDIDTEADIARARDILKT